MDQQKCQAFSRTYFLVIWKQRKVESFPGEGRLHKALPCVIEWVDNSDKEYCHLCPFMILSPYETEPICETDERQLQNGFSLVESRAA